jgi:hypothetical protein
MMNIPVQRTVPGKREGTEGEMRLVVGSGNNFLFIRGGNQWFALDLISTATAFTKLRKSRGDLQRDILRVTEREASTAGEYATPGTYGGASTNASEDGGSLTSPGAHIAQQDHHAARTAP